MLKLRSMLASGLLAFALSATLAGCPGFAPKPETFNERMAAGIGSVTFVRETATTLLAADKVTANDAQNIQDQATNARSALDIAEELKAIDFSAADAKLRATQLVLRSLRSYLVCRESGGANCAIEVTP